MPVRKLKPGITSVPNLRLLADRGIDYLYVNPDTNFVAVIESNAKNEKGSES